MVDTIASLYVGEEIAWLDIRDTPLIIAMPPYFFGNGRGASDQTTEKLENLLKEVSQMILETKFGYLPPGKIDIIESLDTKFNIMVYEAHYQP